MHTVNELMKRKVYPKTLVCILCIGIIILLLRAFKTFTLFYHHPSQMEPKFLQNEEISIWRPKTYIKAGEHPGKLISEKEKNSNDKMLKKIHTANEPVKNIFPGYKSIPDKKALKLRCGTCSLVTSSGHLLNSTAGVAIDNADCVIRMNASPTIGYEIDVGRRTDVRVLGHLNLFRLEKLNLTIRENQQDWMFTRKESRTKLVVVHWGHAAPFHNITKSEEFSVLWLMSKWYEHTKFYMYTYDKTRYSIKMVEEANFHRSLNSPIDTKTFKPTTGWFAMIFALDVCSSVKVYGMSPEWYCSTKADQNKIRYHYYEGNTPGAKKGECEYIEKWQIANYSAHRMMTEKSIFSEWAMKRGEKLTFHYPSWKRADLQ